MRSLLSHKGRIYALLLISAACMLCSGSLSAQDMHSGQDTSARKTFTRTYDIYFRVDRSDVDTSFRANGETIGRMRKEIDSLLSSDGMRADSVVVVSTASPEGRNAYNVALSGRRGVSAARLVQSYWPWIEPETIVLSPSGEDWATFSRVVREDGNIPGRDEIAGIAASGAENDEKERMLRERRAAFYYILRNHAYLMRASEITFNVSVPAIVLAPVSAPQVVSLLPPPSGISRPASPEGVTAGKGAVPAKEKVMIFAARTNLLVPGLNVGIEVPVGTGWSVGVDYYYPWWLAKSNMYCAEMLGLFLDGKYWFGKDRTEEDKLTGHAIGAYVGAGYYDYQWKKSGNQGEYVDVGIDYTYSIPLSQNRLRMEFNVGLGWIHTVARHYTPTDNYGELIRDPGIRHRKYNFFGPTRASVSLVVPIRVNRKIKGGAE